MSDPYLQFEALQHGWRMYMHGKRRSGRTTRLIESMQDGDIVLVVDHAYGNMIQQDAKRAGKTIETYVLPPTPGRMWDSLTPLMNRAGTQRVLFDHTWVECFIAERLNEVEHEFEEFTKRIDEVRARRLKPEPLMKTRDGSFDV